MQYHKIILLFVLLTAATAFASITNNYQVTGGHSDDYPEGGVFDGVVTIVSPSVSSYTFSNGLEQTGHLFLSVTNTNPFTQRWCITYSDEPSSPPPIDCFLAADGNLARPEGTYIPQGYWAETHADNIVVSMIPRPDGTYRWKSDTLELEISSFEIYPPAQYFNIDDNDFSLSYWVSASFTSSEQINFTAFIAQPTSGASIGPTITLGLLPDYGQYRIWGFLYDPCQTPPLRISTYLDGFNWNGRDLLLTMTCDRDGFLKLYLNNVLVSQADASSFSDVEFLPGFAALIYSGNPHCWSGNTVRIDQFRFYNGGILTPEQIGMIWNNGAGSAVNQQEYTTIADSGLVIEFDDVNGYVPTYSMLCDDVWTDGVTCAVNFYGGIDRIGFEAGGVPNMSATTTGIPEYSAGINGKRKRFFTF
jgi:hypothetical protein